MKMLKAVAKKRAARAKRIVANAQGRVRKSASYGKRVVAFPQVRGKTIRLIEFYSDECDHNITLTFNDRTKLSFDIYPEPRFSIMADYSDWTTGNWRPIKRWQRLPSWG
jgi:hypothetical protein